MLGHRRGTKPPINAVAPVDTNLERHLGSIAEAVTTYLAQPSDELRERLRNELQILDRQIERSDQYAESMRFGSGTMGSVGSVYNQAVGATSRTSAFQQVDKMEFDAQVALVRAAKDEVRNPTPDSLLTLQEASAALLGENHPERI